MPASRGYEAARAGLDGDVLRARGRAVGTLPEPCWITYEPDTSRDWVTRRLRVTAETAARSRSLDLRHDGRGGWRADGERLPAFEALDCDPRLCPPTDTMPVLRHGLHRAAGERRRPTAWVSVPDLTVRPSRRTYTHLARTRGGGGRVRFASGTFRSDLDFDADGFVLRCPGPATRIAR
ncbi:putative glycolipid-binding domain-containing protein [Streptomyces bobili]|uniref:putative glycolipid-binding domain-containing protein n=1 Tax=Streptomyces bobili TaxID=67280 RepID=UPI00339E665C